VRTHSLRGAFLYCAVSRRLVGDDVVWLKGNAYEKTAPTHSQERISRISATEPQHRRSG